MNTYYYHKAFKATTTEHFKTINTWQDTRVIRNGLEIGGTDCDMSLSSGNLKLVNNNNVAFLVWNLPAIVTCPFATAMCRCDHAGGCYAAKSEKGPRAKSVLNSRYNNLNASLPPEFIPAMIEHIENIITTRKAYKAVKKIVVRIHESGDFYSQAYFDKWVSIAEHFQNNKKLVFVAYTKSVDFVHNIPANMVIRYSIWDDTEPGQIAKARKMDLPIYTAVPEFTTEPEKTRCRCTDCGTCFKCFSNIYKLLLCEIH
jgi:hypothetical protein